MSNRESPSLIANIDDYHPQHIDEWEQSAIDADIVMLNFESVRQDSMYLHLVRKPKRWNNGRLGDYPLRQYHRLGEYGWICRGINPLTMTPSEWGCVKPNEPRWDANKQKHIKYEHPHRTVTELFCLRVTYRIGFKIARQQGLEAEYIDRVGDSDRSDEDRYFWQWVIDTPSLVITITEGAKKAASQQFSLWKIASQTIARQVL